MWKAEEGRKVPNPNVGPHAQIWAHVLGPKGDPTLVWARVSKFQPKPKFGFGLVARGQIPLAGPYFPLVDDTALWSPCQEDGKRPAIVHFGTARMPQGSGLQILPADFRKCVGVLGPGPK